MRFSSSNFVAAATAAGALLLAACAGHGMVPAANSFAPSAVSPDTLRPDAKATPSPCTAKQTPWVFGGACATVKLTSTGGTAKMGGYNGFTISSAFGSGAKAGTVLMVRDAIGKGDATGKYEGVFFPKFTQYGAHQPYTAVTPVLYIKVTNLGAAFQFKNIPAIQVTSKTAFPGNQCVETRLQQTNPTWQTQVVNVGQTTAHVVKFPAIPQIVPFDKNATVYIAIGCYNKKS